MNNAYPVRFMGNTTPWFDEVLRDFSDFFPVSTKYNKGDNSWFGLDLIETKEGYLVKANLPGMKKEDIEITLDGKRLTIKASHKEEKEEKTEERYLHKERFCETIVRSIDLPVRPSEKVEAALVDGVLTVTLGRDETSGTKKIALK